MKTIVKSCLLVILSASLSMSCKKKEPEPAPPTDAGNGSATVATIIQTLSTPLQTFTVDAGSSHELTCANGTKVFILPDAFLSASGMAVSGAIVIEVRDILSKKDMILNNAFPVCNGQMLVSGGGLYFNASQNGQRLKRSPASSLNFCFPTSRPAIMWDFYSGGPALLTATDLHWQMGPLSEPSRVAIVPDSNVAGLSYYIIRSDSLGWVNCAYVYNLQGHKTNFRVNLQGQFNSTNCLVFLSKNGSDAVAARLQGDAQQFQPYLNSVCVGQDYTIGAIGFDGSNYYYRAQQLTMTENLVIDMPVLVQTTKSQIELNLAGLP